MLENLGGGWPTANLLAVQTHCGVAEARKSDQCALLAVAMALKYARLAFLISRWFMGEGSFQVILVMLWYSLLREESREDHHGLERGQGRLKGAKVEMREVRREDEMSNHLAIALGVGRAREAVMVKSLSAADMASQSRRSQ